MCSILLIQDAVLRFLFLDKLAKVNTISSKVKSLSTIMNTKNHTTNPNGKRA